MQFSLLGRSPVGNKTISKREENEKNLLIRTCRMLISGETYTKLAKISKRDGTLKSEARKLKLTTRNHLVIRRRLTSDLNVHSILSRHGTASKMHRKIAKTQYKLLHLAKNRDHDTSKQRASELESIVNKKIVQNGSETKDWEIFIIFTIFIFFVFEKLRSFQRGPSRSLVQNVINSLRLRPLVCLVCCFSPTHELSRLKWFLHQERARVFKFLPQKT